jgi:sterol desaturase/sphingolipid hydroxylase (fatty acid hydroxylase superfamily)
MIQEQLDNFLFQYNFSTLFVLSFIYFLFLYFALAPLFNTVCKFLNKRKLLQKIVLKEVPQKQIYFEIKHSFKSIILFGFSIIPIVYLIRTGSIIILPNTFLNVIVGLLLLNLWNEIHFFIVHRIMHLPFFMKNVHYIHHQSKVPTVYSVYSFHWLEAFLLSTVPLTICLFLPFSFLSIALYPLASILLNYSGHCNYRFGNGTGYAWKLFGTHHNEHHFKNKKNYGFVLQIFDFIISKLNSLKQK